MVWLLLACTVRPYGPVVAPPVDPPVVSTVSVEPLLQRIDKLLVGAQEVDRRDRLVELRDLVVAAQAMEGRAQASVLRYAERALVVEERAQPLDVAELPMEMAAGFEPVVEVAVEDVDPLVGARRALAEGRFTEAIAACDAASAASPPVVGASALRAEAVDRQVRAESEAAGAAFLAARALPVGEARRVALQAVVVRLQALVDQYPDSTLAAEVHKHLATAQTELAKP